MVFGSQQFGHRDDALFPGAELGGGAHRDCPQPVVGGDLDRTFAAHGTRKGGMAIEAGAVVVARRQRRGVDRDMLARHALGVHEAGARRQHELARGDQHL